MIEYICKSCMNCKHMYTDCYRLFGECLNYLFWDEAPEYTPKASPKCSIEDVPTPKPVPPPKWSTMPSSIDVRDYNIGESDYSKHKIQPWDIWLEYNLNPWDADIIKRILRTKKGDDRSLDYKKIKHICDESLRQLALK